MVNKIKYFNRTFTLPRIYDVKGLYCRERSRQANRPMVDTVWNMGRFQAGMAGNLTEVKVEMNGICITCPKCGEKFERLFYDKYKFLEGKDTGREVNMNEFNFYDDEDYMNNLPKNRNIFTKHRDIETKHYFFKHFLPGYSFGRFEDRKREEKRIRDTCNKHKKTCDGEEETSQEELQFETQLKKYNSTKKGRIFLMRLLKENGITTNEPETPVVNEVIPKIQPLTEDQEEELEFMTEMFGNVLDTRIDSKGNTYVYLGGVKTSFEDIDKVENFVSDIHTILPKDIHHLDIDFNNYTNIISQKLNENNINISTEIIIEILENMRNDNVYTFYKGNLTHIEYNKYFTLFNDTENKKGILYLSHIDYKDDYREKVKEFKYNNSLAEKIDIIYRSFSSEEYDEQFETIQRKSVEAVRNKDNTPPPMECDFDFDFE